MIRIVSPWRFIAFVIGIILLLLGIGWLVWGNATLGRSGEITIASGQSARAVWAELVDQNYTTRLLPWRYYGWRADAGTKIKAGTYHLEKGERVAAVIDRFIKGEIIPAEVAITYPEGFTVEQIAARTEAKGIGTADEFTAAAMPQDFAAQFTFLQDLPAERTLEGYLFPDTYHVFDDDTVTDVIKRMLANFDRRFPEDLRAQAKAAGRTVDEIVIMASIIEREVISDDDMAMVSGVLWKRVDEGMGMDADATIRYAVGNWDNPLTVDELRVDSPYNTRRYRGLPPGPISNPGLRAIMAALQPEESPYYYYLSAPDGQTYFARTNDEHNVNKAKYLR